MFLSPSWWSLLQSEGQYSWTLSLTDSELTRWTGHGYRSPEPVSVICYYAVSESGVSKPSPHSLPATVTVLDQKPTVSVSYDSQYEEFTAACEIPLSGSGADFRCNLYTGHLQFLKRESRRGRSGMWSCSFTASKTDLLNRLQSVKSREVSCDYSLNSDPSVRSPMSDSYDLLNLIPVSTPSSIPEEKSTAVSLVSSTRLTTTQSPTTRSPVVPRSSTVTKMSTTATASSAALPVSTTAMPPSTAPTQTTWHYNDYRSLQPQNPTVKRVTVNDTSEKHPTAGTLLVVVLSVISASAVLVGVVIFLCKKQRTDRLQVDSARRDQGDMMAMLSVEEFSPGAAGTYSMFTSVTTPYLPPDVSQPQLVVSSTERGSVQLDYKKPVMSVSYDSQYEEFTAACEILLSGSGADFRCNPYTGHLQFLKGESRRGRSGKWICIFTASKTDLLNRLQSVKSREVSCDYSLNSDPSIHSPMSDLYDLSNLIPVPTQSSITEEKSTAGQIFLQLPQFIWNKKSYPL
ncbi:hypothetical protein MHYP_G00266120 [Metynnis hypsauchen]